MKRTLVSVVLLAVALTGCGGSSKKAAISESTPSATATEAATPTDTPTVEPTATDAVTLPTDLPTDTSLTGHCADLAAQYGLDGSAFSKDSKDLQKAFSDTAGKLREASGKFGPPNVRAAFGTLADVYQSLGKALSGIDYTPTSGQAPPPAYLAAIKSFQDPKFVNAAKTLGTWAAGGCKG